MRLLHAQTLEFKEFVGRGIPPYTIISHRWTDEEVSYKDYLEHQAAFLAGEKQGQGWLKISQAARISLQRGHEWFWIDTCCIDKSSSAELTEAINSMFKWYERSAECYVFFPDVTHPPEANPTEGSSSTSHDPATEDQHHAPYDRDQFRSSVWYSRAWTLQELLAPSHVYFFNASFVCFGSRDALAELVSEITGIPLPFFVPEGTSDERTSIHQASIADRMSWASRRDALREEDLSYSLLGLFGVNMPLLYGEEGKAFLRLQTEIIRKSNDETIFAWPSSHRGGLGNLLAPNLRSFARPPSDVQLQFRQHPKMSRQHYDLTHKGMRILLPLKKSHMKQMNESKGLTVLIELNCFQRPQLITKENSPFVGDVYLEAHISLDFITGHRQHDLQGWRTALHHVPMRHLVSRASPDWKALGFENILVLDRDSDADTLTPVYFPIID